MTAGEQSGGANKESPLRKRTLFVCRMGLSSFYWMGMATSEVVVQL